MIPSLSLISGTVRLEFTGRLQFLDSLPVFFTLVLRKENPLDLKAKIRVVVYRGEIVDVISLKSFHCCSPFYIRR